MYCHAWLCIAMYCHAWLCIAMYCHVYPCIAMYCHALYTHVLPRVAMYSYVLECIAMYCNILPFIILTPMKYKVKRTKGRRWIKEGWVKETLAREPHDFEERRSPKNAAFCDWCGIIVLIKVDRSSIDLYVHMYCTKTNIFWANGINITWQWRQKSNAEFFVISKAILSRKQRLKQNSVLQLISVL